VAHFLQLIRAVVKLMGQTLSYDSYPKIQALIFRVEGIPRIAAWIAKRPQTDA
jgi:hypothetical protein